MTRSFMLLKFKHNNTMKKSTIIKSVLAAFAFFASAALVSCEKTDDNDDDKKVDENKPAYVCFTYRNIESADLLKYCDVVIEYTDADGKKNDTITAETWEKNFLTQLPCTYSFKTYYTMKADIDYTAEDTLHVGHNHYGYFYSLHAANGDVISKPDPVIKNPKPKAIKLNKLAESISTGYFNTVHEFVFDSDGKLKLDGK